MTNEALLRRLQLMEDRIAIKEIVDTFSNLADDKAVSAQMSLFTEDAVVETYFGNELFARMQGRREIEHTFSSFIAHFETLFHINGQLVLEIDGDKASGQHYCQVMLIAASEGEKTLNTNGVIYRDNFVRTKDGWKIAKRIARFTWRDTAKMAG